MMYLICMLYDKKSEAFTGQPFLMVNKGVAMRSVGAMVSDKNNPYYAIVSDLELYQLGTLNIGTGEIIFNKNVICSCSDLVEVK